jgi:hypothetical protein
MDWEVDQSILIPRIPIRYHPQNGFCVHKTLGRLKWLGLADDCLTWRFTRRALVVRRGTAETLRSLTIFFKLTASN